VSPDAIATLLILLSALLHVVVNAIIKVSDDGLLTRGAMNATAFAVAAPLTLLVPLPSAELWKILLLATPVHGVYPFSWSVLTATGIWALYFFWPAASRRSESSGFRGLMSASR
jgi:hypothetical protein